MTVNLPRQEVSQPVTTMQWSQRGDRCDNALASVEQKIRKNRDIRITFEAQEIPDDSGLFHSPGPSTKP